MPVCLEGPQKAVVGLHIRIAKGQGDVLESILLNNPGNVSLTSPSLNFLICNMGTAPFIHALT